MSMQLADKEQEVKEARLRCRNLEDAAKQAEVLQAQNVAQHKEQLEAKDKEVAGLISNIKTLQA